MELRLKFGNDLLTTKVPGLSLEKTKGKPGSQFIELHARHIATLQKPADILAQALDRPLGCHPFDQVFRGSRNVLIVAPDPAEALSGAEYYLPLLCERLRRLHVPNEAIRILIAKSAATPLPASAPANDYAALAGEKVHIHRHNPDDAKALEYVGITRRGTPIFINRLILDADEVIFCGSVAHHPVAGYGGGPRLLVPGCAGHETIARHHALAIDPEALRLHPRCRDGVVEGNPLQEDAREAFRFINVSFLLHTVFNDQGQMIGAVAGEPLQAFAAACRTLDDMFLIPVVQPASLVIVSSGGFPFDYDFRAAHAALSRASQVVRPGGVIIFVAECGNGLGSPALSRWLEEAANGVETGTQFLSGQQGQDWRSLYQHAFHHIDADALIALSMLQKAREVRIIAVTALEDAVARRWGFTPAPSLPEALALTASWLKMPQGFLNGSLELPVQKLWPDNFSALVIPNGTLVIPYLR
ncbi:MAG: lactate racemase domain-containing protein [bacterium]